MFKPSNPNVLTTKNEQYLLSKIERLTAENAALKADAERGVWILHNAGLLNNWARDWNPDRHAPLIRYLGMRVDEQIAKELT